MSLSDYLSGLFGNDNSPKRQIVELDPETKRMIDVVSDRGMRSEQDIINEGTGFANEAANQVSSMPQPSGGYSPMMGDALRMKYQESAQNDLGRFKLQSEHQGRMDKANQMRTGWEMLMAKQNVAIQNFAAAAEAKMQAERLRSQVLQGIFGAAGQVAGYAMQARMNKPKDNMDHGGWATPENNRTSWEQDSFNQVQQQQVISSLAPGQSNIMGDY